jgi:hypothetical protein
MSERNQSTLINRINLEQETKKIGFLVNKKAAPYSNRTKK